MKRLDQLTQLTAAQLSPDDIIGIRDQSAGVTKYITVRDLTGTPEFGWQATGESHSYSSWDSTYKIGVVTVPTDATTKYSNGMRYRISQSTGGTKYGIIVKVTATTLSIYFGTDYTLNNEAITSPVYSPLKAPYGFPLDPIKWTQRATDSSLRSTASPTLNTWYNPASLGLSVPMGVWYLSYACNLFAQATSSGASPYATLSTANNSESDAAMTSRVYVSTTGAAAMTSIGRRKTVALTSNTPHYLNVKVDAPASTVDVYGTQAMTVLEAICAYL